MFAGRFQRLLLIAAVFLGIAAFLSWAALIVTLPAATTEATVATVRVAIASSAGSTVVAVASLVSSFLQARASIENSEHVQSEQHAHELKIARDARLYERRAAAYVEALATLTLAMDIINRTFPRLDTGEAPPPPAPESDIRRIDALIAAFGSDEIQQLLLRLSDSQFKFGLASAELQDMRRDRDSGVDVRTTWGKTVPEQFRDLDERRIAFRETYEAVRRQVAAELRTGSTAP